MVNILFDSKLGDVTSTVTVAGMTVTGSLTVLGAVSFQQPAVIGTNVVYKAVNASINLTTATNSFTAAVLLTAQRNVVIANSFTSGGPVALPTVANWIGGVFQVFNACTSSIAVWPQPLDIIDAIPTGSAAIVDVGKRAEFYAVSTTGIISAAFTTTV